MKREISYFDKIEKITTKLNEQAVNPNRLKKFKTYYDSPFAEFFLNYKVELVDDYISYHKTIEINYDEFPKKLQRIYDNNEDSTKLILTGIKETFKERAGSIAFDKADSCNAIKFTIKKNGDKSKIIDNKSFEKLEQDDENKIDAIANRLIEKYHLITIRQNEEILMFNGKTYENNLAETIIKEECEKQIENCKEHQRKEVISKIKALTYQSNEIFNHNPEIIVIDNGILNIVTGELRKHSPLHYSRIALPVDFIEPEFEDIKDNLKDTLFWKYLTNSFTVDGKFREEDFETVLEIMASFLIRRNIDQRAFIFKGHGENGKSILSGIIETILGSNNVANTPLQKLVNNKFMIERLNGKLANIFSDIESDELEHSGELKALVCDEPITVERKYHDAYDMNPLVKLLFSCNLFPKTKDQDHGFFRRWIIVEWERNFENDEDKIDDLKNKICNNKEEINLVFSSLIPIAKKLLKNQKFTHTKEEKEVKKLWLENSNPLESWIRRYTKESEKSTSLRHAHDFYKKTMYDKGETPVSMHKLNKALEEEYEKSKDDGQRVWLNMKICEPTDSTMNDFDTS